MKWYSVDWLRAQVEAQTPRFVAGLTREAGNGKTRKRETGLSIPSPRLDRLDTESRVRSRLEIISFIKLDVRGKITTGQRSAAESCATSRQRSCKMLAALSDQLNCSTEGIQYYYSGSYPR